jgi:hypothetical protein
MHENLIKWKTEERKDMNSEEREKLKAYLFKEAIGWT